MCSESTQTHHRGWGVFSASSSVAVVGWLCLFCLAEPAPAEIVASGDVEPADPATWTSSTSGYIGKTASGTLGITNGSDVLDGWAYIGYESGSMGEVTVDGPGSRWNSSYGLGVGWEGSGTLTITGGGAVAVEKDTWVSRYPGSSGAIHLDGGTLTTGGLLCVFDDLTGTGTIDTGGLVSDVDLVFDATHGLSRTFTIHDKSGRHVTVNLSVDGSGSMGAGFRGVGTMSISDGRVIESTHGYIGWGSGSTGAVTVDGAGSTWNSSYDLAVGWEGSGTLTITGGGAVNSGIVYIGCGSGSTGAVTVDGPGSRASIYFLFVGWEGSGTLTITGAGAVAVEKDTWVSRYPGSSGAIRLDGGTLTTGGLLCVFDDLAGTGTIDTGGLVSDVDLVFDATHGLNRTFDLNDNPGQDVTVHLTVDGSGSMGAGFRGVGTMSISDGRVVESTYGYIGCGSASTGAVTVDGPGSTWTSSNPLAVGYEGCGTLTITGGGAVNSYIGYIGHESGSMGEVTVDGAGSTWNSSYDLAVGWEGSGTLCITGGGAVSNDRGFVAYLSGSTGEVTVAGAGSKWRNQHGLYLGRFGGAGTLTITGGGAVSSGDGCIGFESGSTGEVTVHGPGSTWTNSGSLYVCGGPYAGINTSSRGTLSITGGGAVSNQAGYVGYGSGSTGVVTVAGAGSTWRNSAALKVGYYGSGTLAITNGGLVSIAGTLTIDDNGDGDGSINMGSGGMLALKGKGNASLASFLGLVSGTDAIRYWDMLAYDWADITGATAGDDYTLTYLTEGDLVGYSLLTVLPGPLVGDANLDAQVGIADLVALADNYGLAFGASWEQGDFNGDGIVGIADLAAIADNYGQTGGGTVPEPTTLLLLLAVGGIALGRRRRPI